MILTNNSDFAFKAKISESFQTQLYKQASKTASKTRLTEQLTNQLEQIKTWGSPDSEIIVCQNHYGNFFLGLKTRVNEYFIFSKAFEHLRGKTELSQILGLKEKDVLSAEKSIDFLYKRNGADFFVNNTHQK